MSKPKKLVGTKWTPIKDTRFYDPNASKKKARVIRKPKKRKSAREIAEQAVNRVAKCKCSSCFMNETQREPAVIAAKNAIWDDRRARRKSSRIAKGDE